MPAPDSPTVLVARFLKSNCYDKTLAVFLDETGLEASQIDAKDPANALTIEDVLDEKRLFDLTLKFEKTGVQDEEQPSGWIEPHPSVPTTILHPEIPSANVLFVTISDLTVDSSSQITTPTLIATTADRHIHLFATTPPYQHLRSTIHDAPILSVAALPGGSHLVTSSMTGHLTILSAATLRPTSSIKPHSKYATRVICQSGYIASASYDKSICIHELSYREQDGINTPTIGPLVGKLELPTRPEAILLTKIPGLANDDVVLVFSREDSTVLYIHHIDATLSICIERNLSPHENTWSTFHAMSIAPHPTIPGLVAVGTNHVPHMKLLVVDLTKAPQDGEEDAGTEMAVFTGAPQSAYSTAVVAWRPDGGAVWVNSDDGVVRGIERVTGKVKERLEVGLGQKVRTLFAGNIAGEDGGVQREILVTGGFDKRLRIWEVESEHRVT